MKVKRISKNIHVIIIIIYYLFCFLKISRIFQLYIMKFEWYIHNFYVYIIKYFH